MAQPLIIANWKSNPDSFEEAVELARKIERGISGIRNVEVVIAPPYPFLLPVSKVLKKARLGAQNMFWASRGPYTGEVSLGQLKSLGVSYVIIGHSERKIYLGETDELIHKKLKAALEGGLETILCVGERERQSAEIPEIVGEQLKNALEGIKKRVIKNLAVAYEPVWAISTQPRARPDSPDNAFRALIYLRKILAGIYGRKAADKARIIYGGSVSSQNIGKFLREGKMEGALVGGASLNPQEFVKMIQEASSV